MVPLAFVCSFHFILLQRIFVWIFLWDWISVRFFVGEVANHGTCRKENRYKSLLVSTHNQTSLWSISRIRQGKVRNAWCILPIGRKTFTMDATPLPVVVTNCIARSVARTTLENVFIILPLNYDRSWTSSLRYITVRPRLKSAKNAAVGPVNYLNHRNVQHIIIEQGRES